MNVKNIVPSIFIEKTIRIVSSKESGYNFEYWLQLSPTERLINLDKILRANIFNTVTDEHREAIRSQIKVISSSV